MPTLADQISEFKTDFFKKAPAPAVRTIQGWITELSASGIATKSLAADQPAPDFELPNAHGKIVRLAELRRAGPVVVIFYRGEWCPFCNLALRAYQKILPEINASCATLVAISPQTPDHSLSIEEKAQLTFNVLSDQGNAVARRFGTVYRLGDGIYELQEKFGINLPQTNGDDSRELPLPGTFIIDQEGIIRFAEVFADHSQRTEPAAVLAALRELKASGTENNSREGGRK